LNTQSSPLNFAHYLTVSAIAKARGTTRIRHSFSFSRQRLFLIYFKK